jgi:STIP1 family protein 1
MALLKLHSYERVIADSQQAISLLPQNMKAYFQLAQAQIALGKTAEALVSARKAHELCVEEIKVGGKGASSLGPITEVVLVCVKEDWERRERERELREGGLLSQLVNLLEIEKEREIVTCGEVARTEIEERYNIKIQDLRKTFDKAKVAKRRKVPDWILDDITFSVMIDPVVVSSSLALWLSNFRSLARLTT